ncbi:hypothetical protein [Carnobacterium sp. ISL-102]|uniref:hypothetical protein n=1 Tax=Carnobacterium sp. ISL-102 TaxID=2819142 RepID=UPI001BE8F8FC|nr:hypothetical protein [Carnobacterium sp. ISL-102]MBT2731657.1 hypothetical protein [Carnobacterium sp. ISL-102]
MTKEILIKLENHAEDNIVKNEHSKAILGSIQDTFNAIIDYSKVEGRENIALYELERVSSRTESLLNILYDFLEDSTELNDQMIKQITEMKWEEKAGD